MADKAISHLGPGRTVLDLDSGYGGPARYLSARFGCQVVALNLSHVQTGGTARPTSFAAQRGESPWSRARSMPFRVVLGISTSSGLRTRCLTRTVKPRCRPKPHAYSSRTGTWSSPTSWRPDGTPADALRPVLARTTAATLPTLGFYRKQLAGLGFTHVAFEDHSKHLLTHYRRVTERTQQRLAYSIAIADRPLRPQPGGDP